MSSRLRIGDVAALFDVTTKTLRHYEKLGLLNPEREENGYRLFGPEDVLRVQRIRQLQSLGLSLKEVERLLGDDDERLWAGVLRSLRDKAADEIVQLQERLDQIEQLLGEGLPPDEQSLVAPPGKVNEYLERHLPVASLAGWRRDTQFYATLHNAFGSFGEGGAGNDVWGIAPFAPHNPWVIPSAPGESFSKGVATRSIRNGHVEPFINGDGGRAMLRSLQKYGRVIAASEDEER